VLAGLKRFILWDYPRGVWQYDVMCGVILLFIAFAPQKWFRDKPRIPHAGQIAALASRGESVFWIETELVSPIPESQRLQVLGKMLTSSTGKNQSVTRIEPIYDSEREIKGYMAFSKP
jgi:hypothetical protein